MREQYAAALVEAGVAQRGRGRRARRRACSRRCETRTRRLKEAIAAGSAARRGGAPPGSRGTTRTVETAVPAERLRDLNEQLLTVPEGFTVHPKLAKQLERRARDDRRGGRHRLGPGRGPRASRRLARRRHPGPAHRPGHRARHVLAPPPRPPRREDGREVHADRAPAGRVRALPGLQLAALRDGRARLRVRLLGRVPARARPLGGAVRRLRQLGAGDRRPVHRLGALEVAAELPAHAAPSARLRGQRPGALERAASSASCSSPRRRTSGSSTARRRRSTSTSSAARRSTRSRGRSSS